MINHDDPSVKSELAILRVFRELKLSALLRQAGIRKAQGISVTEVFQFLLLLQFQGKNLYRYLSSKRQTLAVSKNTYYRFLNTATYNWRRFLCMLSAQVITALSRLTKPERVRALVLDDSVVARDRSRHVELLATVHDHTENRFRRGFSLLTLGWTDGYSFIPVDFAMMSSAKKRNRFTEATDEIDKRTCGYRRRQEAVGTKPQAAIDMVKRAMGNGVQADYILMDSWFTTEPLLLALADEGIDAIGMLKSGNQRYNYKGRAYTLAQLRRLVPKQISPDIYGSIVVETKHGLKVKLVFVQNRNKKREWLALLSTDVSLTEVEIVRIYGNRWSIEVFFKAVKSLLGLGSEFQGRSYDMMISHTTIVFTRYILLEWLGRTEHDHKTLGELWFILCEDVQDMDFVSALRSLLALFQDAIHTLGSAAAPFSRQLLLWIDAQPTFIKALLPLSGWES